MVRTEYNRVHGIQIVRAFTVTWEQDFLCGGKITCQVGSTWVSNTLFFTWETAALPWQLPPPKQKRYLPKDYSLLSALGTNWPLPLLVFIVGSGFCQPLLQITYQPINQNPPLNHVCQSNAEGQRNVFWPTTRKHQQHSLAKIQIHIMDIAYIFSYSSCTHGLFLSFW